jgi:hypothetical protein
MSEDLQSPFQNQRSVRVYAYNRPVKIAYLVPTSEETRTHWILDAIFRESYTRWGGTNTLVIPVESDRFEVDAYEQWLNFRLFLCQT